MRIQHNIMAMNAYRNYNTNTSALSKNLEKLSSGYRINRAGDDAAGLAISEKMRAQISGLEQASNNVGDGISLVQTAEGALQEVQDMLNRMVTLSEESANGTYQNEVDRENLQAEMDALQTEIDRIADSANFNGIQLLDGSLSQNTVVTAPTAVTVTGVAPGAHNGKSATGTFTIDLSQLEFINTATNASATFTIKIGGVQIATANGTAYAGTKVGKSTSTTVAKLTGSDIAADLSGKIVKIDGATYDITNSGGVLTLTGKAAPTKAATTAMTFSITGAGGTLTNNTGNALSVDVVKQPVYAGANTYAQANFTLTASMVKDGNVITIGTTAYTIAVGSKSSVSGDNLINLKAYDGTNNKAAMLKDAAKQIASVANSKFLVSTNNTSTADPVISLTELEGQVDYAKDWDLSNHTGYATGDWTKVVSYGAIDNTTSTGGLTLQIGDTSDSWNQMNVSIKDMHVRSLKIDTINIKTQSAAASAISVIKDAINYVSSVRGTLGATQNRLEHTANNLSVMTENIQDAESTIRDTDIADEMTAYTKNQILVQSAQAMLAQANSVPQGVLQLLQ
jgi:flagellin